MKPIRLAPVLALGILTSCATSQLPRGAQVVGGGLSVNWMAPRNGTVLLVEASSGKVVQTQSVQEGEQFDFDSSSADNIRLLNSMFGETDVVDNNALAPLPKNSRFVLYFVPGPEETE